MMAGRFMTVKFKIISLLVLLSACAGTEIKPVQMEEQQLITREALPFSVEVQEEVNDGSTLYLKVLMSAYQPWGQDDVLLHLAGLKEGIVEQEYFYRLSKLLGDQYPLESLPGQTFSGKLVLLTLPIGGQTDYQLELLWGKEARSMQQNKIVQIKDLALRKETCEKCAGDKIYANIQNLGTEKLKSATLGVGFVWINEGTTLDLSGIIPENEEQVKVQDLALGSGEVTELKVDLESPIPATKGGHYQPLVRVVEYSVE